MNKLRTMATVAMMAGLVGAAYWISTPGGLATGEQASALPKITKCRPHDDCARMSRTRAQVIEANVSP